MGKVLKEERSKKAKSCQELSKIKPFRIKFKILTFSTSLIRLLLFNLNLREFFLLNVVRLD